MHITAKFGVALAITLVPLLVAAQAQAIDLTGTWESKPGNCKELFPTGEVLSVSASASPMYISQNGTDLAVDQGVFNYDGLVYENAKTGKGKGVIQKCLPDASPYNLATWHITKAETFVPNKKGVSGKMSATLIHARKDTPPGVGFFDECEIEWERVNQTNPGAVGCNN